MTPVSDYNLTAVQLTHDQTGAQHLHIARKDSNNVFRSVSGEEEGGGGGGGERGKWQLSGLSLGANMYM